MKQQRTKWVWKNPFRPKRNQRDHVFRILFEENKQALLELYNALNGTNYSDINDLTIVTLKDSFYITVKNDLAYILAGTISLYEHQSSINPNMPARFFIYLATEYQKFLEQYEHIIYENKLIKLPTPQCIVFYNGNKETAEEELLLLSSAFDNQNIEPAAELKVRVFNINQGCNKALMEKCQTLKGYSIFVEKIKEEIKNGERQKDAANHAIDFCIANGILEDFMRKHRADVLGSILYDFDQKKYEHLLREEGRLQGDKEGYQRALSEQIQKLAKKYPYSEIAIMLEMEITEVEKYCKNAHE